MYIISTLRRWNLRSTIWRYVLLSYKTQAVDREKQERVSEKQLDHVIRGDPDRTGGKIFRLCLNRDCDVSCIG